MSKADAHSSTIWIGCDTGADYQPSAWLANGRAGDGGYMASKVDVPDGYLHWIQIFDDLSGIHEINVFYPCSPETGESIDVIVEYWDAYYSVCWFHGEPGLYTQRILLFLFYISAYEMHSIERIQKVLGRCGTPIQERPV